jgi:hypothetical protein
LRKYKLDLRKFETFRKELGNESYHSEENFPHYDGEKNNGVYSTNVAPLTFEAINDENPEKNLEDKTILPPRRNPNSTARLNEHIGKAVNAMFNQLSSTSDPHLKRHKNGKNNLFFGYVDHNKLKDDEQEVQVALIEAQWYREKTNNQDIYMGISVNTRK